MPQPPPTCHFCHHVIKADKPHELLIRKGKKGVVLSLPVCAKCRHAVKKGLISTGV